VPAATHNDSAVIVMDGVHFVWPGRRPFGLSVESFSVERGERLLLVGPSGSGKSTLLSLLCGVVAPQAGAVHVLGTDIAALRGPRRDRFRAEHFGIIFQMFNLLPYASVLDSVLLPLAFAKNRRRRAAGAAGGSTAEARRLLESLGIGAEILDGRAAATLSVGQQQRVAAARALIGAPEIIVADEPTSALDRDRQTAFLDLLFAEIGRAGATLVMVSHDETLAPRFHRVLHLDDIATAGWSAAA